MKKLAPVCLLILCLSFPAFAGHTTSGFGWCECDNPESHNTLNGVVRDNNQETTPDFSVDLGLFLAAVLLYLRAKA